MSDHARDKAPTIGPFAPAPKGQPDANIRADDSGRAIIALLQKAAEMAKDDCGGTFPRSRRASGGDKTSRTNATAVSGEHIDRSTGEPQQSKRSYRYAGLAGCC